MSAHTEHRDPSPEAISAALAIFGNNRASLRWAAQTIDAKFSDIRRQNDRLKEALATKAESEKGLFEQLQMREEQLEALLLRWWTCHTEYDDHEGVEFWVWVTRLGLQIDVDGPHDQLPPWPDSARKALAEQRMKEQK